MILLLTYLFLALAISFLCSIMEAVLLSTPLSFLKAKEVTKGKAIRRIISLKQNIDKPLSAILSLNTIAHTVGAAGVGAQATIVFGEAYFGIVSAVLTLLILIITEIIPKTIGARHWKVLIYPMAVIIRITMIIASPLVVLSSFITRLFSKSNTESTTSREEISALAHIGTEEGILLEEENTILQNLIKLRQFKVSEIMTPRVVITSADESTQLSDFLRNKELLHFSRIPVYTNNIENITGYVFQQSVLKSISNGDLNLTLKDLKRDIVIVPATQSLLKLWEVLLKRKEHIALVTDEYGAVAGIVTMEDIIETLLGIEIVDEKDKVTDMQRYARERWLKRMQKYKWIDKSDNSQNEK